MKVLVLTPNKLQELHEATELGYFKNGEGDKAISTMTERDGKYLFGVDKFQRDNPNVSITGIPQIDFVPDEIEI